jgi:hypothetical protein
LRLQGERILRIEFYLSDLDPKDIKKKIFHYSKLFDQSPRLWIRGIFTADDGELVFLTSYTEVKLEKGKFVGLVDGQMLKMSTKPVDDNDIEAMMKFDG